jgi:hypothetical protein
MPRSDFRLDTVQKQRESCNVHLSPGTAKVYTRRYFDVCTCLLGYMFIRSCNIFRVCLAFGNFVDLRRICVWSRILHAMDPTMEESNQKIDMEAIVKDASNNGTSSDEVADEHSLSFIQALKLYPTAVGWSMFFSLGVIMTAFDPQLLGSLFATPAFQKDFGYLYEGSYIVSAPWQTALGMGNPIGQVVGALGAGYPMEWYGRKPVTPPSLHTRQQLMCSRHLLHA